MSNVSIVPVFTWKMYNTMLIGRFRRPFQPNKIVFRVARIGVKMTIINKKLWYDTILWRLRWLWATVSAVHATKSVLKNPCVCCFAAYRYDWFPMILRYLIAHPKLDVLRLSLSISFFFQFVNAVILFIYLAVVVVAVVWSLFFFCLFTSFTVLIRSFELFVVVSIVVRRI